MKALSLTIALALTSLSAHAGGGYKGSISFTQEEIDTHRQVVPLILQTAADCIEQDMARHKAFFKKYGLSAFYGDRSAFAKLTTAEKRNHMRRMGFDPRLLEQMAPTSCVGLTRKCLQRGFEAAGQATTWKKLQDYLFANGVGGTALQDGLQKLGWKVAYWNPDVRYNDYWDQQEKDANPANSDKYWGYHAENWRAVTGKRHKYYYNLVDDYRAFVNFGPKVPELAKKIPFLVGTGHMGYHVFPVTFGKVVEGHSTKAINDPKTLEQAPFNPLKGQGPTGGLYKSGLLAIPPGYLD